MTVLEQLTESCGLVVARAGGSVTRIGRGPGRGSGVVTAPGVVVTNAHNLRGEEVTVTFADGRQATGRVAGVDGDGDLAAVQVDTGDAPVVAVADGGALVQGQAVFALGAVSGGGSRVSFGVISAVGRSFRGPGGRLIADAVEHTAPLAPRSSGGPVLDAEGRLVALNTHRLEGGFYLAQPTTSELMARLAALAAGDSPRRVHLGVALTPERAAKRMRDALGLDRRDGLLVAAVEDSSPAAGAGIRKGDLIVAAAGAAVVHPDDLFAVLAAIEPGGSVVIRVLRQTDEIDLEVSFPAHEPGQSS